MKGVFAIATFLMFMLSAHAQIIRFNKSYMPNDSALSLINQVICTDSTYLFYGVSNYINPLNIMTFMTDSSGNMTDSKYFGDSLIMNSCGEEESLIQKNDNPYLVSFRRDYNYSPFKWKIISYEFSGIDTLFSNVLYSDTFSCAAYDNTYIDGYLYSIGTKAYDIEDADHYDAILIKSDTLGNMVWMKRYGSTNMDWGWKILNTYDNHLIMAVERSGYPSSIPLYKDHQWWILKLDTAGNIIWDEDYGHPDLIDRRPMGLIETSDSCYIITGSYGIEMLSTTEIVRGRILKIDQTGNIVWDRLYGYKTRYTHASIIKEKPNGEFICIFNDGPTAQNGYLSIYNPMILNLTNKGDIKWFRHYYYSENNVSVLNSFDFTNDGGYIFAGYGIDPDSLPSQRSWVIKTDSLGFDGTYYSGDTTLAITLATDTVCYNDSVLVTFHITGKSAPYSIGLSNGSSKDSIFYSPYYEEYAFDSLFIYPSDSLTYHNITATVTDPWGNTVTENFAVYVDGCWNSNHELIKEDALIKIYPNPTDGNFYVSLSGSKNLLDLKTTIKVTNISGQIITEIPLTENETSINTKNWAKGIYICNIYAEEKLVKAEKLILK